jgi:hypothetical protein
VFRFLDAFAGLSLMPRCLMSTCVVFVFKHQQQLLVSFACTHNTTFHTMVVTRFNDQKTLFACVYHPPFPNPLFEKPASHL